MKPIVVRVSIPGREYPIVIGHRHLRTLPAWIRTLKLGRHPVVITNATVWARCGVELGRVLRAGGLPPAGVVTVPDSEQSKSLAVLGRVLNRLAGLDGIGRRLFVLALGGGVVGDLAGLAAALYRRGIPSVQLPTTLLAQVDSAIGGKTAVDLAAGKNLVGAFYQPRLVFTELAWLDGLPGRQGISGFSEIIKAAMIRDPALFRLLSRRRTALLARQPAALQVVVARAARIKAQVVARDERETSGLRMILNFGHTIGHAIEAATQYRGPYTHGEAVAIGMSVAAAIARELGVCPAGPAQQLNDLLEAYGLPTRARKVKPSAVLAALGHDKKVRAGRLRWVLPTRIGHVIVTPDVPSALVRRIVTERVRPSSDGFRQRESRFAGRP